jgi:isoquinoline 1-oxidoreductase alpha subunit
MPNHTFSVNGKKVTVDVEDDVRLLWVLRDVLKIHGPKYGCGIGVCRACTCHLNGKAFNPCVTPVKDILPTDEVTTIEGLAPSIGKAIHPMQQAWLDVDVAQCGYCQPGQIMQAVDVVKTAQKEKRQVTENDLDQIRNVCRCGTYPRIREAIKKGEAAMPVLQVQKPRKKKPRKRKKPTGTRRTTSAADVAGTTATEPTE